MKRKDSSPDSFRLQALAKTISDILHKRFGKEQYYSAAAVEAACNECKAPDSVREYAVAMFVKPEETQGFLQKLGSSKTALELRKFLASEIFFYYSPDVSYGSTTNTFHDVGSGSHHGGHGYADPGTPADGHHGSGHSCGSHHSCSSHSCGGHSCGSH